ncbi:MAG: hypothetical protein JWN03_5488 [Nocardia sp.]|uniref:hypothetical protein n=1 Tax=Nocardia sp. TaxID=1821 RepID=UPI00262C803F|nr:hypothetical protein [Nocardia sp.]MCU1645213.1 hypothetical protein [Nocardia sp.]
MPDKYLVRSIFLIAGATLAMLPAQAHADNDVHTHFLGSSTCSPWSEQTLTTQ